MTTPPAVPRSGGLPDVILRDNRAERLACVVVVDGSLSMSKSGAIHELNEGLKIFEAALKDDDEAAVAVQVAILRMGDQDRVETLVDFVDAVDFEAPTVLASGSTPLGKAVDQAMAMIEQQKQRYRQHGITYKRPWLFVMTDGAPTDGPVYDEVAGRARAAQAEGRFSLFAVAIGPEAKLDQLARMTHRFEPVRLIEARFREMFVWLGASMSSASRPAAGQQLALPPPTSWAVIEV